MRVLGFDDGRVPPLAEHGSSASVELSVEMDDVAGEASELGEDCLGNPTHSILEELRNKKALSLFRGVVIGGK